MSWIAGGGIRFPGAVQQGNNSVFLGNPSTNTQNRPENICEFSCLRDLRDEIPCAAEQGINSSGTGKPIFVNRELIRANRELILIGDRTDKWLSSDHADLRCFAPRNDDGRGFNAERPVFTRKNMSLKTYWRNAMLIG